MTPRFAFALSLSLAAVPATAEPPGLAAKPADAGTAVMSLAAGPDGAVWVGTEDRGVLRYDPAGESDGGPWRRFTTQHGLGDPNGYALVVDPKGRVWASLRSRGVAVFDGAAWRTYGPTEGPLGSRVFDLAVQPGTGDVWIATEVGLTRYRHADDSWAALDPALSAAEGAASRQIFALAFAPDGRLFAGTACHGVAVATPADDYATWEMSPPPAGRAVEFEPTGDGLPTNLINDVLVHSSGVVYAATTRGLAERAADGNWRYTRGRDYAEKAPGRLGGPPDGWKPVEGEALNRLMPADYLTCLAEDGAGRVWVGCRGAGLLIFDPKSGDRWEATKADGGLPDDFVTSVLPLPGRRAVVGTVGGGVAVLDLSDRLPAGADAPPTPAAAAPVAAHPAPAAPPTEAELRERIAAFDARTTPAAEWPERWACHLGGDWQTQGDWLGRYGRGLAVLAAAGGSSSQSDEVFWTDGGYSAAVSTGPDADERASHTKYVRWPRWLDTRALYNPRLGYRRQASWNDNGWLYPMTKEGPDLWVRVTVPDGLHRLGVYLVNKDGHDAKNRTRDLPLEIRTPAGGGWDYGRVPVPVPRSVLDDTEVLATARVRHHWGGVYQRFGLRGPGRYLLRVVRNDSNMGELSGLFLDRLTGEPDPADVPADPDHPGAALFPPAPLPDAEGLTGAAAAAAELARRVVESPSPGTLPTARRDGLLALRALSTEDAPAGDAAAALADGLRWSLPVWTDADRTAWTAAVERAWQDDPDRPAAAWPKARPAAPTD